MPITVGTTCYRNPALTREQFRTYFEETHVPLLQRLCSSVFSTSGSSEETTSSSSSSSSLPTYRRNYTSLTAGKNLPFMLHGSAEKVDWDCFSEVTFASMQDFQIFATAYAMHKDVINEDEKRFFDVERLLVCVYETEIGIGSEK